MKSYVELLKNEYLARKKANPAYSERAFAKKLGISPSFLKALFQGKKHLSEERAKQVAQHLNWSEPRQKEFINSFNATICRKIKSKRGKSILKKDDFTQLAEWFCFASIELLKIRPGAKITEIAESFKILPAEAKKALETLAEKKMVSRTSEDGFEVLHTEGYEMPSLPSESIRRFHRQMLSLAIHALEEQPFEKRDFRALTLAFDKERVDEAKACIDKFVSEFETRFSGGNLNAVYQLSTSFFQLDKGNI